MAPTYVRTNTALWHRTSRRTLVNLPGVGTFELQDIAALVWDALAQPVTLDDLADDLAAVFDQPVEVVRDQVSTLVTRLVVERAVDEQ